MIQVNDIPGIYMCDNTGVWKMRICKCTCGRATDWSTWMERLRRKVKSDGAGNYCKILKLVRLHIRVMIWV